MIEGSEEAEMLDQLKGLDTLGTAIRDG